MLSQALFQGAARAPNIKASALLQGKGMLTGIGILGKKHTSLFNPVLGRDWPALDEILKFEAWVIVSYNSINLSEVCPEQYNGRC